MSRFTLDFSPEFVTLLEGLAESKGLTKAEILRRAVASYSFLDGQTRSEPGRKVSITNQEDKVLKDVVLP
jgi:hypothetical protein